MTLRMPLVLISVAVVADSMSWFVFGKTPEAPRIEDSSQLQCVVAADISKDARKNLAKLQKQSLRSLVQRNSDFARNVVLHNEGAYGIKGVINDCTEQLSKEIGDAGGTLRLAYDVLDNGYKFDAEYFGSVYKFLDAARSNKSAIDEADRCTGGLVGVCIMLAKLRAGRVLTTGIVKWTWNAASWKRWKSSVDGKYLQLMIDELPFAYDSDDHVTTCGKRDLEVGLYELFGKKSVECTVVPHERYKSLHLLLQDAHDAIPDGVIAKWAAQCGVPTPVAKCLDTLLSLPMLGILYAFAVFLMCG